MWVLYPGQIGHEFGDVCFCGGNKTDSEVTGEKLSE